MSGPAEGSPVGHCRMEAAVPMSQNEDYVRRGADKARRGGRPDDTDRARNENRTPGPQRADGARRSRAGVPLPRGIRSGINSPPANGTIFRSTMGCRCRGFPAVAGNVSHCRIICSNNGKALSKKPNIWTFQRIRTLSRRGDPQPETLRTPPLQARRARVRSQ